MSFGVTKKSLTIKSCLVMVTGMAPQRITQNHLPLDYGVVPVIIEGEGPAVVGAPAAYSNRRFAISAPPADVLIDILAAAPVGA